MGVEMGGAVVRRVRATRKGLAAATGAADETVQERLVRQLLDALWLPVELSEDEQAARLEAAYALLQELQPRDAAEGMLAAQMVAVHGAALDCLRRVALPGASDEIREAAISHAIRLMALYPRQLALYDRRRGIGHQTMTVEHVMLPEAQHEAGAPLDRRRSHRRGALAHAPEPPLVISGTFDFSTPEPQGAVAPAEE